MREDNRLGVEARSEGPRGAARERSPQRIWSGATGIACSLVFLWGCAGGADGELTDPGGGGEEDPPPPPDLISDYELGDTVGELELSAPSISRFILHGTMPLPRGIYPIEEERVSPFVVRSADGEEVNAQVEIVTRYPNPEDGADVIEILATVNRPANAGIGDRIRYSVIWSPHYSRDLAVDSAVRTLLETPGSLVLRTSDVFTHEYQADLLTPLREQNALELEIKRDGPEALQVRTHQTMMPEHVIPGTTGTLPHMLGVHAYVTSWANAGFISIDLRIHNGHDGHDQTTDADDPLDTVYFKNLELVAPEGWTLYQAFPTPSVGIDYAEGDSRVWPLVKANDDGTLNVMHRQAMFHRRLVLAKSGAETLARATLAEEGLGFCVKGMSPEDRELCSWWNVATARYWPQNLLLPDLDYLDSKANFRTRLGNDFNGYRTALRDGTIGPWPIVKEAMGWAHTWGPSVGNMHGGAEIYFWDGLRTAWAGSNEGYRSFQISHRMCTDRHPTALYDQHGKEHQLEDWIVEGPNGPYLPTWMWIIPWLSLGDAFGFLSAPTFQVEAVRVRDLDPIYDAALDEYDPIDSQHLIRYTRSPKVLAWLGNDALAKDDLALQGQLSRASYSLLPQKADGTAIVTGALSDWNYVQFNPGDGFTIDRGEGWIFDTIAAGYAVADPAQRDAIRSWFDGILELIREGQSTCTGSIMSMPNMAHFGAQYRLLQSISECILQNGLWGIRSTMLDDIDPTRAAQLDQVMASSCYVMISDLVWDPVGNTPFFYTALGPFDQSLPAFCSYVPPDGHEGYDGWQTWNVFNFGYRITRDRLFLDRAQAMAGGLLTVEEVGSGVFAGELENRAGMVGLLQEGVD